MQAPLVHIIFHALCTSQPAEQSQQQQLQQQQQQQRCGGGPHTRSAFMSSSRPHPPLRPPFVSKGANVRRGLATRSMISVKHRGSTRSRCPGGAGTEGGPRVRLPKSCPNAACAAQGSRMVQVLCWQGARVRKGGRRMAHTCPYERLLQGAACLRGLRANSPQRRVRSKPASNFEANDQPLCHPHPSQLVATPTTRARQESAPGQSHPG